MYSNQSHVPFDLKNILITIENEKLPAKLMNLICLFLTLLNYSIVSVVNGGNTAGQCNQISISMVNGVKVPGGGIGLATGTSQTVDQLTFATQYPSITFECRDNQNNIDTSSYAANKYVKVNGTTTDSSCAIGGNSVFNCRFGEFPNDPGSCTINIEFWSNGDIWVQGVEGYNSGLTPSCYLRFTVSRRDPMVYQLLGQYGPTTVEIQ